MNRSNAPKNSSPSRIVTPPSTRVIPSACVCSSCPTPPAARPISENTAEKPSSTSAVTCLPLSAARASALTIGRVAAGAVERLLDREHVGVVGGARDELDHRVERVVGVVEEDVALADHGEDVVRLAERRADLGGEGLVAELAALVVGDDAERGR